MRIVAFLYVGPIIGSMMACHPATVGAGGELSVTENQMDRGQIMPTENQTDTAPVRTVADGPFDGLLVSDREGPTMTGILVVGQKVGDNDPMGRLGLSVGDIIMEINGVVLENVSTLQEIAAQGGIEWKLTVLRDGKQIGMHLIQ